MPSSVDWVMVTTPGWARCTSPKPQAWVSMSAGVSLPSDVGIVQSLRPAPFSGAPPSSTLTCADAAQTTASQRLVIACSATTLAPVPLNTGNTSAAGPKCDRMASVSSAVVSSSP